MAPERGMPACATLAVAVETALIALAVRNPHPDLGNAQFALSYTTGLLAPGLLLFGGAIARRRNVTEVSRDAEPLL